jgi:acyl carrier protein
MDSLAVYELLVAVEGVLGVSLPPERVVTETFTTPKTIAAAFADGHG